MSRSGYSEDNDDTWALIRWRGAVMSSIKGQRGQKFMRELLAALEAMPEKELIAGHLIDDEDGIEADNPGVCALGCLGRQRGIELGNIDPEDSLTVSRAFGIAEALSREVVYVNDDDGPSGETPQQRWGRVRAWVAGQVKTAMEQGTRN